MTIPITLKVYDGGKLKTTRAFRSERIRIGSGAGELLLEATGVEPAHAVIDATAQGAVLRAEGNAAVFLNGQPILAAPLRNGDLISIGELRLMVELRPQPNAQPAPTLAAPPDKRHKPSLQLIRGDEPAEPHLAHHAQLAVVRDVGPALLQAAPKPQPLEPDQAESIFLEAEVDVAEFDESVPAPVLKPARKAIAATKPANDLAKPKARTAHHLPPLAAGALLGGECAEAELFWGDTRLSVWQLAPGQELVAGSAEGCDALLHGIDRATVIKSDVNGWTVTAPRPLSLSLLEDGRTLGGSELLVRGRSQADAQGLTCSLPQNAMAVVRSGELALRIRRVPSAARAGTEPSDWRGVVIASIAAVLFVGAMRVAAHSVPPPQQQEAEVIRPRPMIVRAATRPPDPMAPLHQQEKAQGRRDPGQAVARHLGTEGEAGTKTAPRRNTRAERSRDERAVVANTGLLKALGSGKGATDLFGAALDKGTRDAMGHLTGPRVADARGEGGMGLKSLGGSGGGGDGSGLGLARIGTNGIGGGAAGYGDGKGGLRGKENGEIGLGPGEPLVEGRIDPELIRKVVHEHRAQIRTCYETQLISRPNLAGKLISAWTIDEAGNVTEAHTQESSLHDRTVEHCVASKIKSWRFPIPKGGGQVFVTYPFIFTPGG